ncbi:hypothetical protein Q8G50_32660, partial [Klebsiella pneumoniae]
IIGPTAVPPCGVKTLRMTAGPEIQLLENAGIFAGYTEASKTAGCPKGIPIEITYLGAVDMKVKIAAYANSNPGNVDIWWAPSPLW